MAIPGEKLKDRAATNFISNIEYCYREAWGRLSYLICLSNGTKVDGLSKLTKKKKKVTVKTIA